jgi:exonuclease SbcC
MKILKLKSKNINSLKGEVEIDFTKVQFQNKIFAIVGKTGSGKTSLLDAISLALYAQTSRLKQKVYATISEGCSDAFCEVVFEAEKSVYRSRFEQKKEAKEIVSDMHLYMGEKIICSGVSTVCKKIESLLGFDFEEFSQSIVLSQGVFDRFLKSDVKERTKLLEKVSNTEVYIDISKKVFQRAEKEAHHFERMKAILDNLVYLEPKEREKIEERVLVLDKEKRAFNIEKIIHKYNEKLAFDKLSEESRVYKAELEKLQKVLLSKQMEEKSYQDFMRFLTAEKKKLDQAKLLDHELEFSHKNFMNIKNEIHKVEQELAFVERAIKESDSKLSQFNVQQTLLKKELNSFTNMNHLQQNYTLIASKFNERIKYQEELKNFQSAVDESLNEAPLCEKITFLESRALELDKTIKQQSIERVEQHNLILENKIMKLLEKENLEKHQSEALRKKDNFTQKIEELNRKNLEIEEEKHALEEIIVQLEEKRRLEERIINYERDRELLKENQPCPLCGSKEHPLFSEKVEPNKTEKLLDEKKLILSNSLELFRENEKRVVELETELKQLDEKLLEYKKSLMRLHDAKGDIAHLKEEQGILKNKLNAVKYQRDELNLTRSKIIRLKDELSQLRVKIQKNKNRKKVEEQLKLKIQELSYYLIKTLRMYNIELDTYSLTLLDAKRKQYEQISLKLKQISQEIQPIEGEKLQNASKKLYIEESLRSLKKRESTQKCDMLLVEQNRVALINNKKVLEYSTELESKAKQKQEAYDDFLKLKTLFQQQKARYFSSMEELEHKQKLKLVSLKSLEKEKNLAQEKWSLINQELGALKSQIEQDKENVKKREQEEHSLEEQEKISKEWSRLNEMIGSKDGLKYQIFAQTLTLSSLITLANEHLKKLNQRYSLSLKEGNTLELEVIDLLQNNAHRAISTLSGGESFIISLALSLGLLSLNSEKIEINTLFLDEGFETLDEESLQMVLDALGCLESEGKIIGIISHIPFLKEQITTQIKLEKQQDGFTKLVVVG